MSVFDETWRPLKVYEGKWRIYPDDATTALLTLWEESGERAHLASAAPDLYRALARLEWQPQENGFGMPYKACAECGYSPPRHWHTCALDAALRKARGET